MKLFDYQIKVINDLYTKIRESKRKVCLVAPTGAGKTVMMGQICKQAVGKSKRVLILVHLDILVPQTQEKLEAFGLGDFLGFIKAGYPESPDAPIQIASIQTLGRRSWWKNKTFDLIIYDECHLTAFSKVGRQVMYETHPESLVVGFTATPYRLSKREGLKDHFEDLVTAPTPKELQDMGRLSRLKYYGIGEPDLSDVRTVAGDFNEADLAIACETPELISKVVEEYNRLIPGKTAIAFCVSISHAEAVKKAFNSAGIASDIVTGETPIKERKKLYKALADGYIKVLTSVGVISIGFDVPSVDAGFLLRPTKSLALHQQQIGRVMRVSPGKDFGVVLDQAGNVKRHGFPEDITEYSLDEGSKKKKGEAPVKECPECGALINTFLMVCPDCGHIFPAKERLKETGRLVRLKPDSEKTPEEFFKDKLKEAYKKKYAPGWAIVKFKERFGEREWPQKSWYLGAVFGGDESKIADYYDYLLLKQLSYSPPKPDSWVLDQLGKEFGLSKAIVFVQRTNGGCYVKN